MTPNENQGLFKAVSGYVYQIPSMPLKEETTTLLTGAIYTETLQATGHGITAKDAFVFSTGKHPTRNIFAFYRRDIGDVTWHVEDWDTDSVSLVPRAQWMNQTEEDAMAEIEARAADPNTRIEELILESILGMNSRAS